jgi:23S rRNA pseudouridine2605 synthase
LNKPRGLVTTASDEKGRATVFQCLPETQGHLCAVGRLDQASEGLLLFTNDTGWADGITDPRSGLEKVYHVQVDRLVEDPRLRDLETGTVVDGEHLAVRHARVLRRGERHCWLELVVTEGRNRHLRRLLGAFDMEVLRLVRVAIGGVELGSLAKGQSRSLTKAETEALRFRQDTR